MNANYWQIKYSSRRISDDYDGWLDVYGDLICPGSHVLDLGCGTGTDIDALLNMGAEVTAADFSENGVITVRENFAGSISGADCFDMRKGFPYADASFDVVVADLSLHYFSWADTRSIIDGIRRILKIDGRLIARVHSLDNLDCAPDMEIETHYYMMYGYPRRYFSREELEDLLEGWRTPILQAKGIHRYNRTKHVFEFVAEKL